MAVNGKFYFVVVAMGFLMAQPAFASGYQFTFGGGEEFYSGVDNTSLAPNSAVDVHFGAKFGEPHIVNWVASTTLMESSGTADFKVSGTSTSLAYSLYGGEFDLGLRVTPFAHANHLPIEPFFGAAGALQLDSVKFGTTTSTTFPRT